MTCRLNKVSAVVVAPCILQREADSMVDRTCCNFVVTNKTRENCEPGCIARSPAPGPLLKVLHIPDRFRIRGPGSVAKRRVKRLVQHASISIQNKNVLVINIVVRSAGASRREALDRRGAGEGSVGDVALVRICDNVDGNHGSGTRINNDIRNAVVSAGN